MDLTLLQNYKDMLSTQYNEMVVSLLEQYKCEMEDLNKILVSTTAMIKEKEILVEELQTQVDDNKFEESNFNNVSIIQNLNKQIYELTNKNEILTTSLKIRKNNTPTEPEPEPSIELVVEQALEDVDNKRDIDGVAASDMNGGDID